MLTSFWDFGAPCAGLVEGKLLNVACWKSRVANALQVRQSAGQPEIPNPRFFESWGMPKDATDLKFLVDEWLRLDPVSCTLSYYQNKILTVIESWNSSWDTRTLGQSRQFGIGTTFEVLKYLHHLGTYLTLAEIGHGLDLELLVLKNFQGNCSNSFWIDYTY